MASSGEQTAEWTTCRDVLEAIRRVEQVISRAYIHVTGRPGVAKTTLIQSFLRTSPCSTLVAHRRRDDRLRRARETNARGDNELRRYRPAGATGAVVFTLPPNEASLNNFFEADLISCEAIEKPDLCSQPLRCKILPDDVEDGALALIFTVAALSFHDARVRAALFEPWTYSDEKLSMRRDLFEDRRYALMDRDPTAPGNKSRTVWMANLLAYRALVVFPSAPERKNGLGNDRLDVW